MLLIETPYPRKEDEPAVRRADVTEIITWVILARGLMQSGGPRPPEELSVSGGPYGLGVAVHDANPPRPHSSIMRRTDKMRLVVALR